VVGGNSYTSARGVCHEIDCNWRERGERGERRERRERRAVEVY
tara:strand:- start:411 stop:539 length:129 start_codon:yes stop_codon:yes gene_type:complete